MTDLSHQPVICLLGPTACGKTDLALSLAQKLPCEIISVDSALVYRGMDIGTAKPSDAERAQVPHHLIDICEPTESYSTGRFCQDAMTLISSIHQRGRIPLLVGGTMLYHWHLQQGIADLPEANQSIRQKIAEQAAESGWQQMHVKLQAVDAASAQKINPNDPQRISRALEVFYATGIPLSEHQQKRSPAINYQFSNIILDVPDRAVLRSRIADRFHRMLDLGLLEEVKKLMQKPGIDADLPAMRMVGYRQVLAYLMGNESYDDMVDRGIISTCQLAKRQLTWLRRWAGAAHFDMCLSNLIEGVMTRLLLDERISEYA